MATQANLYQNISNSKTFSSLIHSKKAEKLLLITALIAVDLLMLSVGFSLAYFVRFELAQAWFFQSTSSQLNFYSSLVFLLTPIWIVVFKFFNLYDLNKLFSGVNEYAQVFNACTLGAMIIVICTFFDPDFIIARAWLVLAWAFVILFVLFGRFSLRRVVQQMRAKERFLTRALVIGANEEGQAIAEQLLGNPKSGVKLVGFVDNGTTPKHSISVGLSILGSLDAIINLIEQHGIEEVIISSTALSREELLKLVQTLSSLNLPVYFSSGLYEMLTTGVEVREVNNVPLLKINKVRLTGLDLTLKRLLDVSVSLIALFFLLPVMAIIGMIVRFDSKGPIFHLRRVVGVGGKQFNALKFRTMYVDADERLARDPELLREFERNFKLKDDPRVTRAGKFLRKTSLDELPQLMNVLIGQMSLVGPRMITEGELALYGKWQMNLATVKPGITGLWQVSGRSDVSYDERVKLDMQYIRNYTIWFDIYILWRTIPVVLSKHGAY